MNEQIQENIRQRNELGHRIRGMHRYWKVALGGEKKEAWGEYIKMRIEYKHLMDEFDTERRIEDHTFSLERHTLAHGFCRYWPRNGNGI